MFFRMQAARLWRCRRVDSHSYPLTPTLIRTELHREETAMRTLAAVASAVLLLAGFASEANAVRRIKAHKHQAKAYVRSVSPDVGRGPRYPQRGEWYEHIADKLPFG